MASDISNSDDPFEVRDAGDGKGLGCFATRDINPGETVLVAYTSITYYDSNSWNVRIDSLIDLYERLDISDKRAWAALHGWYNEGVAECDPNVVYECNTYADRWVGRASRHIATGEELTIAYIPGHGWKEERRRNLERGWGFACACPKCTEGPDTYTASLERARDIVNGLDGSRARPVAYEDDIAGMAGEMNTRVKLLREIVELTANPEEKKWRSRELAIALWDGSIFHRQWRDYWLDDEGGDNKKEAEQHSKMDYLYCRDAVNIAKNAWSRTHEMYKCLQKEAEKGEKAWNQLRNQGNGDAEEET